MYIRKTGRLGVASACLALVATMIAVSLSIIAGWQRGGLLAERVLIVCVGVLLVVAAHLLPALCRPHRWQIRALGVTLWIGCMTATCYGHAVFFVMAQKHAGDLRAAVVPVVSPPGRNLADIANDRAGIIARLARVTERKCGDRCAAVRIERTTLNARLVALDAESAEVGRHQLALDRADAEHAAAKADPLAGLLTDFGVARDRVDLVAGMSFAVVIEGVACFCWLLALRPVNATVASVITAQKIGDGVSVTRVAPACTFAAQDGNEEGEPRNSAQSAAIKQENDLTNVQAAIREGKVRATVADIRRHLRCSQAKAAAFRRQVAIIQANNGDTADSARGGSTARQASLNLVN